MTAVEWGIWLIYFVLFTLVIFIYKNTKGNTHQYMIRGYLIKVLGGIAFASIYLFYYGYGDTFLYQRGANVMSDLMLSNPGDYFRLLWSNTSNLPKDLVMLTSQIQYSRGAEEWFMVKLLSPISLISFGSYIVMTFFMSLISFFGAWKIYKVFADVLPTKKKYAFWAVFLVPSVVFWGSGIMKDTVTLACINILINILYFTVFKRKISFLWLVPVPILLWLIFSLKAYIILAFLPALFLGVYSLVKGSIRNQVIRLISGPAIFFALLLVSYFGLSALQESSAKYNTENIEGQVRGFHTWHSDVGGSTYSLGDVEYTPIGVISKIPAALNVAYFRPYIWEARNPVVAIGAFESIVFLGLTLLAVYRYKFKLVREIKKSPILYALLVYCLIFGFAVGFTSYNFGALARYKIPVMSLFAFLILYLYENSKKKKTVSKPSGSDEATVNLS